MLCYIILGIWTVSLLQFTMVLTATRARRDQIGLPMQRPEEDEKDGCCNSELYGIMVSIVLQDLPFLCVRLLLIFKYKVVSYTNMFFTSKNTLVIVLLIYRLIVVQGAARRRRNKRRQSLSSMMSHMNDLAITVNGGNKQLRHKNRSKSSPNVYNHANADGSLPRQARKKGHQAHHGNRHSPMLALQDHCNSDPNLLIKSMERSRQKSSSPALRENVVQRRVD